MVSDNNNLQPVPSKEMDDDFLDVPDSLISKICDQFNLKESIIKLSHKTSLKITPEFLDATILFLFFLLVFRSAGILKYEFSLHMITLIAIGISATIEIIAINTSLFRKLLGRDENTKNFIKKLHTLTPREIKDKSKNLIFSSKCINYFFTTRPQTCFTRCYYNDVIEIQKLYDFRKYIELV